MYTTSVLLPAAFDMQTKHRATRPTMPTIRRIRNKGCLVKKLNLVQVQPYFPMLFHFSAVSIRSSLGT